MQNVDIMSVHAEGQGPFLLVTKRFRVVGDLSDLFMANQVLKDAIFVIERVVAHASLSGD